MRVRSCVVTVLAASMAVLAGGAGSAGAAEAAGDGVRSVSITDPEGDVIDVADADTVRHGRSVDITRAEYRVDRVSAFGQGRKKKEQVTFEVHNRRILHGGNGFGCDRQLLTVTFSSGARQYRATAGARLDLVSRVGSGPWEPAGTSYGGGCGGGSRPNESTFEFSAPASTFRAGEISDIRSTLRVKGSRARDVVDASTETLVFGPRR